MSPAASLNKRFISYIYYLYIFILFSLQQLSLCLLSYQIALLVPSLCYLLKRESWADILECIQKLKHYLPWDFYQEVITLIYKKMKTTESGRFLVNWHKKKIKKLYTFSGFQLGKQKWFSKGLWKYPSHIILRKNISVLSVLCASGPFPR